MKKIRNIFAGMMSLLLFITPMFSYAYDPDDYEIRINDETEEEYWYLDGSIHDGCTATLSMYVYMDNSSQGFYDGLYDKAYYTFNCYTNIPEKRLHDDEPVDYIHLCKPFILMGKDPIAELEHGSIYFIRDSIEPGDYTFCFPNAVDSNNLRVLSRDFKSPMTSDSDAFYTEGDVVKGSLEVVSVSEDVGVNVYAYFGGDEWSSNPEVLKEYAEWAKENEKDWEESTGEFLEAIGKKTPASKRMALKKAVVKEPTPTPIIDDFVPADGPTREVVTETTVLENVPDDMKKADQKKDSGASSGVLLVVGLVVVGGCAGAAIYLKNRE